MTAIPLGINTTKVESIEAGIKLFGDGTLRLVKVTDRSSPELFVHQEQTDRLLVLKGSFTLVILYHNIHWHILLSEDNPQVVVIPGNIPHGSIVKSDRPCIVMNAPLYSSMEVATEIRR